MKLPSKIEAGSSFPVVTLPSNWNVDLENVVSTCDHEDKDNVHEDGRATAQEEPGFLTSREPRWDGDCLQMRMRELSEVTEVS